MIFDMKTLLCGAPVLVGGFNRSVDKTASIDQLFTAYTGKDTPGATAKHWITDSAGGSINSTGIAAPDVTPLADCQLAIINSQLSIVNCELSIANCEL